MTIEQLLKLRYSSEVPYNHLDYTIWLHNQIIESIQHELRRFRESEIKDDKSAYETMVEASLLPALETIH